MMLKYMPRPQKKRGNNGRSYQRKGPDEQNSESILKGKTVAQKLLKSTIYNTKFNDNEIILNLYPFKLNVIPSIVGELIRCIVTESNDSIKRICLETGYGKPKKSIDIRKCVSHFLTNRLGYNPSKGNSPKTFKFLTDRANRIIVYPQKEEDFYAEREEIKQQELPQSVIDAMNAKKERKRRKLMKRNFVVNKRKKNRKYAEKPKKKKKINIENDPFFTPGGNDNDNINESEDDNSDELDEMTNVEETEEAFLRNFANLQVAMDNNLNGNNKNNKKNKKKKDAGNIFDGMKNKSEKYEYHDPDYWRYRKKPELVFNLDKDDELQNISDDEDWICEFCTFANASQDVKCGMCFTESFKIRYNKFILGVNKNNKINKEIEITTKQQNSIRNAENDNKIKWECEICTFLNTGNGEFCDMCNTQNIQQTEYLDYLESEEHDKFFNKKKAENIKKKKFKKIYEDTHDYADDYIINNEDDDDDNDGLELVIKNNKKKAKKQKKAQNQIKLKKHQLKYENENQIPNSAMHNINGQISSINREWQSQIWHAHNDKQKRIEMLKRMKLNNNNDKDKNKNIKIDNYIGFVPHSQSQSIKEEEEDESNNNNQQNQQNLNKNTKKNKKKQKHKQNSKNSIHIDNDNFDIWDGDNNFNKNKNKNKKKQKQITKNNKTLINTKNQTRINPYTNNKKDVYKQNQSAPKVVKVNLEWVDKLVAMGFNYDKSFDAVSSTNSKGFNQALDYLMQNLC